MCHTCFTGLTIVGKLVFGKNKDTRDVTSIIISLFGNKDVVGGNTLYFNFNEKDDVVASIKFKHRHFQTGDFHDFQHSGDNWTGRRGIFLFI